MSNGQRCSQTAPHSRSEKDVSEVFPWLRKVPRYLERDRGLVTRLWTGLPQTLELVARFVTGALLQTSMG